MSFFDSLHTAPPDPLFGILDAFNKDSDPNKLNLGIGAYRDEDGKPWVLPVIRMAEKRLVDNPIHNKEYLPITGLPEFCAAAQRLALGEDSQASAENRVFSAQTLSGTGALCLAFNCLKKFLPGSKVYISDPTWANHKNLITHAGLEWGEYAYYSTGNNSLNFKGMISSLKQMAPKSIVLLHVVAHNPTGVDPSPEQWESICQVMKERQLYALFDNAYQGFASGDLYKDAAATRVFDRAGMEFIICQSFAKNFGLYGERCGAIHFVVDSPQIVDVLKGNVSKTIRALYSNPPRHGAEIVAMVLNDPDLKALWHRNLQVMAYRIDSMRKVLFDELIARKVPGSWNHILDQIGMFTYLGVSPEQVQRMTQKHHIYLTVNGRISMAGLNEETARYLAGAIAEVIKALPTSSRRKL